MSKLTDGQKPVPPRIAGSYRPERTKAERRGQGAAETTNPPYAALLLRKESSLPSKPVRATAYVCGLGYHELSINGRKVGDHVLDPGFTDYTKRVLYVTHDVTDLLKPGRNAIGAVLGRLVRYAGYGRLDLPHCALDCPAEASPAHRHRIW